MQTKQRKSTEDVIKEDNLQHKGTIYKRGKMWWLEYFVNGERIRESLETTDHLKAIKNRRLIVAPITAGQQKDKLRAMHHRVRDSEEERANAQEYSAQVL